MKGFLQGKPIFALLGLTALISVAVIAVTMIIALATSGKAPDKVEQAPSATQSASQGEDYILPESVSSTQETTEAQTTQKPTEPDTTASAAKVNVSGKFTALGISRQKLSRMIYATYNSDLWHEGKMKSNNSITYGLAEYLRIFSTDFGLIYNSIWYDAPKALDSRLKKQNLRCTGAVDIDLFNKIVRDLYGPQTPTFSYSDFPSVSSGNTAWRIMRADSSYGFGECLIMAAPLAGAEFESNSGTLGEYVGFSVKNGLISAIYVNLYDHNSRPTVVLVSEIYFAKDSEDNYYMHSVNPDRFATGDSEVFGIDKFNDYVFYEIFADTQEPHKLIDFLPEYLKPEKTTTAAPTTAPQKSTAEQAYSQIISTANSDPDLENAHDLKYCLFDVDKNGTPELIISGEESMGWYFSCIYSYNSSSGKAEKVDVLFHHQEIRYSPKFLSLAVSETASSYNYYECVFYKLSNGKLVLDRKVTADRYETEDYVYHLTDSNGNSKKISNGQEYFDELQTIEMVSI